MCVVSMVGDHYTDKFKRWSYPTNPNEFIRGYAEGNVSRSEFEALEREVKEMKKLLERAVQYDKDNNEPHCETDDKIALLKKIAEAVGVDLSDVFED